MKRKYLSIILVLLLAFLVNACKPSEELITTPGIIFEMSDSEDAYIVTGYTGDSKDVVISGYYNDLPVVSIAEKAFINLEHVESITLPDSITSIGMYAFLFTSIEHFTVPINLTYFGQAFGTYPKIEVSLAKDHNFLKEVDISNHQSILTHDNVELIYVEKAKTDDSVYTIPDYIDYIGPRALANSGFKEIFLPESLIEIKFAAFSNNQDTIIHLPDYVEIIGVSAFSKCGFSGNLILPEGLIEIGNVAFYENALTSVEFPSTIEKIGGYVFDNSNNPFPNKNDIHTLKFKSYLLQGDAHEQFSKYFIYANYSYTLIDTLTIYLPDNVEQAERLREAILYSMEYASNYMSKEIEIVFIP
ncbi:MAG: leucine-rich repeat domain-containing protein [Acholeplasmataceae bacterium]|nr:leucine-rich repeat domain-containing protein [Acholeplasmataceae bacterium]